MVEVVVRFKDEIVVKVGVSTTSPVGEWVGQKNSLTQLWLKLKFKLELSLTKTHLKMPA